MRKGAPGGAFGFPKKKKRRYLVLGAASEVLVLLW